MQSAVAPVMERGQAFLRQLVEKQLLVPLILLALPVVEVEGRQYVLPASAVSIPGFSEVLSALRNTGHNDSECIYFLLTPSAYLAGKTPLDALREGSGSPDRIAAVRLAAQIYLGRES